MNRPILLFAFVVSCAASLLSAQAGDPRGDHSPTNMAGHNMSGRNGSDDMSGMEGEGSGQAMNSMQGHQMDMGPHMKMTAMRDPKPGDRERADQVVRVARKVAEKYTDYRVALADGFTIFMPNIPQKMYHFTNHSYALEAASHFNPDHPTALLYERKGEAYKLIGLMYTAPRNASEDELESRIPLSVAQWHAHVNLCIPPAENRGKAILGDRRFGAAGSIATRAECDAAGGEFRPQVFGWMVHVYPFEENAADIWSVERQRDPH